MDDEEGDLVSPYFLRGTGSKKKQTARIFSKRVFTCMTVIEEQEDLCSKNDKKRKTNENGVAKSVGGTSSTANLNHAEVEGPSSVKSLASEIQLASSIRLTLQDFTKTGIDLAKFLLGKRINRVIDNDKNNILSGTIVETEAYLGEIDGACHTYGGKRTGRTEPMYMVPGTAYIYFIYGMYFCLNISSQDAGGCVLIRALEPVRGQSVMEKLRKEKQKIGNKPIKEHALCNGPSKLCNAMAITKDNLNKENMAESEQFWIEKDMEDYTDNEIVVSKRIGIDSYGEECASKPFRFYLLGNKCVSVRDKNAESMLNLI